MSLILKKIVLSVIILFIVSGIVLIFSAISMGIFATVDISSAERGPYYYVTFENKSSQQDIDIKIDSLKNLLDDKNIPYLHPVSVFFEDPSSIPVEELNSHVAFLVNGSVNIDSSLAFNKIEPRLVIIASIDANPAVACYKTYPELNNWLRRNNLKLDDSKRIVEHYYPDGLVEVEFPIKE